MRSRIIESRTQYTNCLYCELVISVSSIQKLSTDTPREDVFMPHSESIFEEPILYAPLYTSTMLYGVGSSHTFPTGMPTSSPPIPMPTRLPPHDEMIAIRSDNKKNFLIILIFFTINVYFYEVATLV